MKRLQYLRTLVPSAKRLCWLWGHETSLATRVDGTRYDVAASLAAAAAQKLQFETRIYHVTGASEIDKALADAVTWQAQVLTTSGFPPFLARREVAQFALLQRWPSAFAVVDLVQVGGLLSLAVADSEVQLLTLRWVEYIDRVLRGAKPADMPVIGADRYELQINVKTAETLGLSIPQSILSRADGLVRRWLGRSTRLLMHAAQRLCVRSAHLQFERADRRCGARRAWAGMDPLDMAGVPRPP
jgi:putative tryptophan/tyrosine transport system substrate-binding protein